jgi:hypothetical protein
MGNQFVEYVSSHGIWGALNELGPVLDEVYKISEKNEKTLDVLNRIKYVLTFIGNKISGIDPYIIPKVHLDDIKDAINEILREAKAYTSDKNQNRIGLIGTSIDKALTSLARINVNVSTEDFINSKKSAEEYRDFVSNLINNMSDSNNRQIEQFADLKKNIEELKYNVISEKDNLSKLVADQASLFAAAQESRSTEYIKADRERNDKYDEVYKKHSDMLQEVEKELSKEIRSYEEGYEKELSKLISNYNKSADIILQGVMARKEEVEKLVGVIGNLGVTSGYQVAANNAHNEVDKWQRITVISMVGLVVVACAIFLPSIKGEFSWSGFAGRVFISLTFGLLAGYAASQADKYQKIEQKNRKLALELEAIRPFIAPLPEQQQQEFILAIGNKSFGQLDDQKSEHHEKSPTNMMDLFKKSKEIKDFVVEIIKASKSA